MAETLTAPLTQAPTENPSHPKCGGFLFQQDRMTGRPSIFTQDIADQICEALESGRSLRSWCMEDDTRPNYGTIFRWLKEREAFCEDYARAREVQAHNDADRINAIAEALELGAVAPDVARVITDAMKWTAARRLPKVYGDKVSLTGQDDGAPLVVTWLPATK